MKKIIAGVLVAALIAWWVWPTKEGTDLNRPPARRVKVERGDITVMVAATGEIRPLREVELKSKASGRVVKFPKQPGETVEEGELIAELDKETEQRNLGREEANLSAAEAQLELTKLEYARSLKQGESEVAAAREDEKQKKADLARMEQLRGEVVAESELGNVRVAARLAEEKTRQAEATLTLTQGRRAADEKLAASAVQRARVTVEDARDRLRDTELRAPMKGILLKKLVEEGQIVASGISATTGGTAVAVVADVSRLLVEANVDETDIVKVKKGQAVEVSLLSGASDRFAGAVDLILPRGELDSNVIVFKVRITLEGDAFGRAYPGMTASVSIRVDERKGALLVPTEAIHMDKGQATVQIPEGDATKAVQVRTGLDDGVKTEILEGLAEGAEVVIQPPAPLENKPTGRPPRIR